MSLLIVRQVVVVRFVTHVRVRAPYDREEFAPSGPCAFTWPARAVFFLLATQ